MLTFNIEALDSFSSLIPEEDEDLAQWNALISAGVTATQHSVQESFASGFAVASFPEPVESDDDEIAGDNISEAL